MLRRKYPPNAGKWNGVGGKIEAGETPLECASREVMEEADMDASSMLRYAGIVRWNPGADPTSESRGMQVFIAELPGIGPSSEERETPEGLLAWKPLSWACDPENDSVVSNIPRFLPMMFSSDAPMEFRCEYEGERLVSVAASPL